MRPRLLFACCSARRSQRAPVSKTCSVNHTHVTFIPGVLSLVAAVSVFGVSHLWAGAGMSAGEVAALTGPDLAGQMCLTAPTAPSDRHGVFVIKAGRNNKREVPVDCKVELQQGKWEAVYETSNTASAGPEKLVIIHNPSGPNEYLYARASGPGAALPEPAPLPPGMLDQPFGGSDFSIGELGLDFFHWSGQHRLAAERRLGQPCAVLESTNGLKSGIVRIRSSIDEENLGLLYAEGYDNDGNKIKEFSLDSSSFKKDAQGHGELKQMGIDNLKLHSHTDLKFDTVKY